MPPKKSDYRHVLDANPWIERDLSKDPCLQELCTQALVARRRALQGGASASHPRMQRADASISSIRAGNPATSKAAWGLAERALRRYVEAGTMIYARKNPHATDPKRRKRARGTR
jgi:hypothetical protein